MSADPSPMPPDADAAGRGQVSPVRRMALGVTAATPTFGVALALASLAGFVAIAGTFLVYDARGGLGPLGSVNDSTLRLIGGVCSFVVAPVTFAFATLRFGVRGAIAAALGVMIVGPVLWGVSPLSSVDSSARYGYYDEGRGWLGLALYFIYFWSFVIVAPIAFVVRWIGRRASTDPDQASFPAQSGLWCGRCGQRLRPNWRERCGVCKTPFSEVEPVRGAS